MDIEYVLKFARKMDDVQLALSWVHVMTDPRVDKYPHRSYGLPVNQEIFELANDLQRRLDAYTREALATMTAAATVGGRMT